MSITVQERHDIAELLVLMFNATPGSHYLSQIVTLYENNGHSLQALANTLGQTPAFNFLHDNFQSAGEFAADLLAPLGLSGDFQATTAIVNAFNAGVSKGAIMYGAFTFLNDVLANPSGYGAQYVNAANIMDNKADVSIYFSVTKGISAFTLADLQAPFAGVTASDASVTAANAAIDANYTPQTFNLSVSTPTITEGDDGSKLMTFTLTLDQVPNAGSSPVSVSYQTLATGTATAGDDFITSANTVSFGLGQTVATVSITVLGDAVVEANETVNVLFTGAHLAASVTRTGTITNDDSAPVFSTSATQTLSENLQTVTVVTATDLNGDAITYSIAGGTDAADFTIDPISGQLDFAVVPNFEAPADSNSDNVYSVTVRASDGRGNVTDLPMTVTVADVFEPPPNLNVQLSTGADTGTGFVLGLGNDTFNARFGVGAATPLNTTDVLNGGGAGTDLVTALLTIPGVVRPTLSNIDIVDVEATSAGVVVDLLNTDADLDTVRSTQSTMAFTFDNVGTPANVEMVLTGVGMTVLYRDAALTGTNNINVTLDNVTGGTVMLGRAAGSTVGVAETITVNSTIGAANTLDNVFNATTATGNLVLNAAAGSPLTVNGSNATIVTAVGSAGNVTFSGDVNHTFAGGSGTDTLNVKAGIVVTGISGTEAINIAAGGSATVTDGTAATITFAAGGTVTAGSGNDSIDATAAGTVSIVAGAGNDTINMGTALTSADTVVAGGDTNDTLRVSATVADGQFLNVSGTDVLQLDGAAGATLDTLAFAAAVRTINGANGSANVVNLEEQSSALTIAVNGGTGAGDTVNVLDGGAASAGTFTLNLTGVEIVSGIAAGVSGMTVNVNDSTGTTFTGSGGTDIFNGGGGADVITAGLGGDFINGGAGSDSLSVQAGGTVIISGVETFNTAAGGTNLITVAAGDLTNVTGNLGAGTDTVVFGNGTNTINVVKANLTAADILTGGTGVDTLNLSGGVTATAGDDAKFTGKTGFDVLGLLTTTGIQIGNSFIASGLRTIMGASGEDAAADNLVNLEGISSNVTLTIDLGQDTLLSADQDTDVITFLAGASTGRYTLNTSNVEVINAAAAGNGATIAQSGSQAVVITGSTFADNITGGDGNDTINPGSGYDVVNGGAGNDAVNVVMLEFTDFAQSDTLIGGTGTDTLTMTAIPNGSVVGDLVLAATSGFEVIKPAMVDAVAIPGVTETAVITFNALAQNQSITIDGRTVTATGGPVTAAALATAFTSGITVGTAVVSGAAGTAWTPANTSAGVVTYTSTSANTNVADLTPTFSPVQTPASVTITETQGNLNNETATFTFTGPLTDGQSITIAGRVVTKNVAVPATTADLATAFITGINTGAYQVSGSLVGFTAADNGSGSANDVIFTSVTPSTNVTDITSSGGAGAVPPAPVIVQGAAATTETSLILFTALAAGQAVTIAGRTVTATALGATSAQVATAFGGAGVSSANATVTGALTGWTAGAAAGSNVTLTTTAPAGTNVTDPTASYTSIPAASIASQVENQGSTGTPAIAEQATLVITEAIHDRNEDGAGMLTVDLTAAYQQTGDRVNVSAGGLSATNHMTIVLNGNTATDHFDNVATGAGNDIIVVGASGAFDVLSAADTIMAGTGTDVVQFNNTGAINAVLDFSTMTGLESAVMMSETANLVLTLQGAGAPAAFTVTGGTDASLGTTGALILAAGGLATNLTVTGTTNADGITTGSGADNVNGGDGNDNISTGAGVDMIAGGAGNDFLNSGTGNDTIDLTGGGSDQVVFNSLASNGLDTVTGFQAGATASGGDVLWHATTFPTVVTGGSGASGTADGWQAYDQNGGFDINITDVNPANHEMYAIINGAAVLDPSTVKALSGNTGAANEILIADGASAFVLQAASNASTSFNLYRLFDSDGGAGVVVGIELVGMYSMSGSTFDGLVAANVG